MNMASKSINTPIIKYETGLRRTPTKKHYTYLDYRKADTLSKRIYSIGLIQSITQTW